MGGAVGMLPESIQKGLGFVTSAVTYIPKVAVKQCFKYDSVVDYFADESSITRWLLTKVGLGVCLGFTDSSICNEETKFIAKAIQLSKNKILAGLKKTAWTSEQEQAYDEHIKSLFKQL